MSEKSQSLNSVVRRFVEDAGMATQSFGFGRVVGQVYAYLYLSPEPRNLGDMQENLGISKGSASTGVRQLEQWGGVRKVWVKGDRKDYYVANEWLGKVIKNILSDLAAKRIGAYSSLLDDIEDGLEDMESRNGEREFVKKRVKNLRGFERKVRKVWDDPLIRGILK